MGLGRLLVKSWLGLIAGDYAPYKVYSLDLELEPPVVPRDPEIEMKTIEEGSDFLGLGAFIGGERACACWIWWGERYRIQRNFWPLAPDEAKLVHIETNSKFRGRSVAVHLLSFAQLEMRKRGFRRMFARIWHNNLPSIRAFAKAGWSYETFVLDLEPFRIGKRVRLKFKGRR